MKAIDVTNFDELWDDISCAMMTCNYVIKNLENSKNNEMSLATERSINSLINDIHMIHEELYDLREEAEENQAFAQEINDSGEISKYEYDKD